MNAASQGYTDMVKLLLSAGADPTAMNTRRETAFDLAAQCHHAYACHVLHLAERQWIRNQFLSQPRRVFLCFSSYKVPKKLT